MAFLYRQRLMKVLENLKPASVFGFFEEISAIPRGSYNNTAISNYLVDFAKERNLKYIQDEAQNVLIYKPAAKGYENAPTIILQGHMDMVCEKIEGCTKDMSKEGIELVVDGDWLRAKDTTLGADNGIAVAIMLAILDDNALLHPALECIFTTDEETGLEGATAFDASLLAGRTMINLDSEDEGIITVGCAGGVTANILLPYESEAAPGGSLAYSLVIDGLRGGHSGVDINLERANSNILMGRLLEFIRNEAEISLSDIAGGRADNVICKRTEAVILVSPEELSKVEAAVLTFRKIIAAEYQTSDPEITITLKECNNSCNAEAVLTAQSFETLVSYLLLTPYGVQNMSPNIQGLVETSLNLGALCLENGVINGLYSLRSSVETRRDLMEAKLKKLAGLLGGRVEFTLPYPAWEYKVDSPIRDLCAKTFTELYNREPVIEAIHAGLECGLFAGKLGEEFDATSIGPQMHDVHTPDEALSISSTERFYKHLTTILERAIELK